MNIKQTVFVLGVMIIAFGCTPTSLATTTPETFIAQPIASALPKIYKFTIATGIVNSNWYKEGNGFSSEINTKITTVSSNIKETASLMDNADLLTSGKAGLVFVYDYHVVLANKGKLMNAFPDAPIEKIVIKCGTEMARPMFPDYAEAARIILPLYEEQLYIIASDASGITSVKDLKGKHISAGETGSATEQQARFVFTSLGIDWENEISRKPLGLSSAISALKNGEVDALLWSGYSPNTELSSLLNSTDTKFSLISVTSDDVKNIIQVNPGVFHASKIPANTYSSNQEDVDILATTVVLAGMEDFPEEHVPLILAAFFDSASAEWKNRFTITPEASIALLNTDAKSYLHRGAVSYFTEQGVLK